MALAMATLCFCPPEIWDPLIPTFLSKPCPGISTLVLLSVLISSSSPSMKANALAYAETILISSSVASYLLYLMFSLKVPLKSTGS
jgi:hypothetical protein